jgi:hypothetical protein
MPTTLEALAIILVAVVPGYIAVTLWARTKTWERPPTDLALILLAIIFSAVIQGLLFWLTVPWLWPIRDELIKHPWRVGFWAFFVLILLPAIGGIYAGRLSDLLFGARPLPRGRAAWKQELLPPINQLLPNIPPTSWDKFFLRRVPPGKILVITLDDGKQIAGSYYGTRSEGSFSMTTPQKQGIFLNREWTLDATGEPGRPIPASRGVLIPRIDNIKHIRVFDRERMDEQRKGGAKT